MRARKNDLNGAGDTWLVSNPKKEGFCSMLLYRQSLFNAYYVSSQTYFIFIVLSVAIALKRSTALNSFSRFFFWQI